MIFVTVVALGRGGRHANMAFFCGDFLLTTFAFGLLTLDFACGMN